MNIFVWKWSKIAAQKKVSFVADFALVHPPMALVLLSASVERCFVSRMRDFFLNSSSSVSEKMVFLKIFESVCNTKTVLFISFYFNDNKLLKRRKALRSKQIELKKEKTIKIKTNIWGLLTMCTQWPITSSLCLCLWGNLTRGN